MNDAVQRLVRTVRPDLVAWGLAAVAIAAVPLIGPGSRTLTVLSQFGCLAVMCLSFNLLFGQGGLLSFGHAVYTGLGAFAAVHAMNLAGTGRLALPLPLVPLVGGAAGLLAAALLAPPSARKAGTPFAMITLGVGELVHALALMFPAVFGGEGGIATNRVYGAPLLGWTFGPALQVYALVAVWAYACAVAMYAFTATPLGRLLNAVRDNPERVSYIGYDPHAVRCGAMAVSGFFAGIGGALSVIVFEIVTADALGSVRSGTLLLFTVVGGTTVFAGPVIGAALMVTGLALLSDVTRAWSLYLGLGFMLVVLRAPGGVAGLVGQAGERAPAGRPAAWGALGATALAALIGPAVLVEVLYRVRLEGTPAQAVAVFGLELQASGADLWTGAALLTITAGVLHAAARRAWRRERDAWAAPAVAAPSPDAAATVLPAPPGALPSVRPRPSAPTAEPALALTGVQRAFGATPVLRGVTLTVRRGERVALIGPNGAGKSTLFDIASGRTRADAGRVHLDGRDVTGWPAHRIQRQGLARSFQVSSLFGRLSAFENVRCAVLRRLGHGHCAWRRLDALVDARDEAASVLARIGLAARRDVPAAQLSYAEQRALEVGLTIASGAGVILLDEPTAGMSRSETAHFVRLIREVTEGRTLLVVEHDMDVVFELADHVAVLVRGEIVAFDTPAAVRADPRVQEAYLGARRDRGHA